MVGIIDITPSGLETVERFTLAIDMKNKVFHIGNSERVADNTIKHPGGRPISVPWRFDENHNIIIMNPTKRDYNINYYKNIKSTCELCNRQVVWKHMKRHQMSDICKKMNNKDRS